MATHSSFLAESIPWTEEPAGYGPWGRKELDTSEWLSRTPRHIVQIGQNGFGTWAHLK